MSDVEKPERDCSIIDKVLPAINDGMAHRLFALCGAPVSVSIHVIDVNGDVHASHNFATQGDHDMFVCAIADDVRTAAQSSLAAQRVAAQQRSCDHISDRVGDDMYACIKCGVEMNT